MGVCQLLFLILDEVWHHSCRICVSGQLWGQDTGVLNRVARSAHAISWGPGHKLGDKIRSSLNYKRERQKWIERPLLMLEVRGSNPGHSIKKRLLYQLLIVNTFLIFGWSGGAFGQNRDTVASLSPLSWQHMQDLSVSHSFEPDTWHAKDRQLLLEENISNGGSK